MQNKPNFRKAKMKLNFYLTKDYENEFAFKLQENKANQSQFQRQKNAAAFDDSRSAKKSTIKNMDLHGRGFYKKSTFRFEVKLDFAINYV